MEDTNIHVDKRSKILFIVFGIVVVLSVWFTYQRTVVQKDFEVYREPFFEEEFEEEDVDVVTEATFELEADGIEE